MTKESRIICKFEQGGAPFLRSSSVWDVHNSGMGANKKSNVYKDVMSLFLADPDIVSITCKVGRIGRGQHTRTNVLLFDTSTLDDVGIIDIGYYYSSHSATFYRNDFITIQPMKNFIYLFGQQD